MKHLVTAIAAFLVFATQVAAQVKISEIMYNPRSAEDDWEWIELHNPTSSAISLSGYVVDDENSTFQTGSNVANVSIPAGESVILINGGDITESDFKAAWGSSINVAAVSDWGNMAMGNGGDHVGVWSSYADFQKDTNSDGLRAFNFAVSHVDYDDDGTTWVTDDGYGSIYLKDITASVNNPANWVLSTDKDGFSWTSTTGGGNSGEDVASPGKIPAASQNFTLQLLHYADVDGNEEITLYVVDEFSGLVDGFKKDATYGSNSLLVSSGDIIIPGPRFYAAEDNKVRGLTGSNELELSLLTGPKPNRWWGPFPYNHTTTDNNEKLVSWFEKGYGDYVTLLINFDKKTLYGSAIIKGEIVHFEKTKIQRFGIPE